MQERRAGMREGRAGVLKGRAGVLKGRAGVLKGRAGVLVGRGGGVGPLLHHYGVCPVNHATYLVSLQENTTDIDENVRDRVSDEIKRFRENYKVWWCAGSGHVSTSGPVGSPVVNTAPHALLYAV